MKKSQCCFPSSLVKVKRESEGFNSSALFAKLLHGICWSNYSSFLENNLKRKVSIKQLKKKTSLRSNCADLNETVHCRILTHFKRKIKRWAWRTSYGTLVLRLLNVLTEMNVVLGTYESVLMSSQRAQSSSWEWFRGKRWALIETFIPHINHSVGKSKVLLIMSALIMDTLQPKGGDCAGRDKAWSVIAAVFRYSMFPWRLGAGK